MTTAEVYVLARHVGNRPHRPSPLPNAGDRVLLHQYAQDGLQEYPALAHYVQTRNLAQAERARSNRTWALGYLAGSTVPARPGPSMPVSRQRMADVLDVVVDAGYLGVTRPEVCRILNRDGGKVSAALTMLHEAGIIFALHERR